MQETDPYELFMSKLQKENGMPAFKERLLKAHMIFPKWHVGQVPEFGIRARIPPGAGFFGSEMPQEAFLQYVEKGLALL